MERAAGKIQNSEWLAERELRGEGIVDGRMKGWKLGLSGRRLAQQYEHGDRTDFKKFIESFLLFLSVNVDKSAPTKLLGSWSRHRKNVGAGNIFSILAHSVYKMSLKQEPNILEIWNKLHSEEKETESVYVV